VENVLYSRRVSPAECGGDTEFWVVTNEVNGLAVWRGTSQAPKMVEWVARSPWAREQALEVAVAGAKKQLDALAANGAQVLDSKGRRGETLAKLGELRREIVAKGIRRT